MISYLNKKKDLFFAFVYLEITCYRVKGEQEIDEIVKRLCIEGVEKLSKYYMQMTQFW